MSSAFDETRTIGVSRALDIWISFEINSIESELLRADRFQCVGLRCHIFSSLVDL